MRTRVAHAYIRDSCWRAPQSTEELIYGVSIKKKWWKKRYDRKEAEREGGISEEGIGEKRRGERRRSGLGPMVAGNETRGDACAAYEDTRE